MNKFSLLGKILLGNLMIAFAINMFVIPFGFISGGSTGIALIVQHFTMWDFTFIVSVVNVSMFLLGYACLGKHFALTTILSTCVYPVFLKLTAPITSMVELTNDPLVACLVCAVMCGIGLGLVIQSGASTGGMDIPPLILEKVFKIKVALSLCVLDTTILLLQTPFSSLEGILCGCIMIFVTTFVMNQILMFGKSQCQVMIISDQYQNIRDVFIHDLSKGVTMFMIETGYYEKGQKAVCSIVSQKDLATIKQCIHNIDPDAFMIVSKVQEVRGFGFKPWGKNSKIKTEQ